MAPVVRVVYADDDPLFRTRMTKALLEAPGIELLSVCVDGASAINAVDSHDPDVAIIDRDLRHPDGLAVAEMLRTTDAPRTTGAARTTRVLLLSALPLGATRRTIGAVGPGGVLDRSLGPPRLINLVRRAGALARSGPCAPSTSLP